MEPKLRTRDVLALAVVAQRDRKTVIAAYRGARVLDATREDLTAAALVLGLPPPPLTNPPQSAA